jgi:hypothetical protein
MCKKFIVLGVLAVAVGGLFVFKTQEGSLVRVWWNKLAKKAEKKITPEDRVEQLKLEIKKIDQAIEDEKSDLAEMEAKYDAEAKSVRGSRARQEGLEAKMARLETGIEEKKTQVTFEDGKSVQNSDFARELVRLTRDYEGGKKALETREQIQKVRKEALETREKKIRAMIDAREELKVAVAELESQIELMRLKQVEGRSGDDQIVGRTQELLDKTRLQVETMKKRGEIDARFPSTEKGTATSGSDSKVTDEEALELSRKARGVKPKADTKDDVKKTEQP